ncbi:arylsulfatase B-like [Ptychodera flava]|uniref:arylsulfatase B-like n=1 Tax=Ptychodera flava TaxID=63121 RepID=UPI00396A3316
MVKMAKPTKFLLIMLFVILAVGGSSSDSGSNSGSSSSEEQSPTHIIYMLADDLGWNDLSWHDNSMITPNLQQLADEGVILENLYTMAVCSPTRTSLMTGKYASRTGTQHLQFFPCAPIGLPTDLKTLPESLREVGYKTYTVGKWHLGMCKEEYLPNSRGVDKFYGFYQGGMDYYTHDLSEYGAVPGKYSGVDLHEDIANQTSIRVNASSTYSTELFRNKILQYIDDHDKSDPMFLLVSFQQPHRPPEVPSEWAALYADSVSDLARRNYSGQVTIMDDVVGDIRAKLEEKGMFDDSLIIFHSDNGGSVRFMASNWPYRGSKGSYFEGGIKAAGLIAGKGIQKTGYRNYELYHVTDMYPTLVKSVAEGTITHEIDGVDIWQSLSTGSQSPRAEFLIVVDEDLPQHTTVAALRYRDWKLIEGYPAIARQPVFAFFDRYKPPYNGMDVVASPPVADTTTWLFDLRNDPYEEYNIADDYPCLLHFLQCKLDAYREVSVPPLFPPEIPNCDQTLYEGYWSPGFC